MIVITLILLPDVDSFVSSLGKIWAIIFSTVSNHASADTNINLACAVEKLEIVKSSRCVKAGANALLRQSIKHFFGVVNSLVFVLVLSQPEDNLVTAAASGAVKVLEGVFDSNNFNTFVRSLGETIAPPT